jgi:hypothetical protein
VSKLSGNNAVVRVTDFEDLTIGTTDASSGKEMVNGFCSLLGVIVSSRSDPENLPLRPSESRRTQT